MFLNARFAGSLAVLWQYIGMLWCQAAARERRLLCLCLGQRAIAQAKNHRPEGRNNHKTAPEAHTMHLLCFEWPLRHP